jgi:hypothetical protein
MSAPFNARFSNGMFCPVGRYAEECASWFKDGEIVRLEQVQERSMKSHNHQFAWLIEAWKNLPEDLADDYPTYEHLRKRALIQAGYFHETAIDVGSKAGALRVAADYRSRLEFAYIIVRGPIVIIREAMSQRKSVMGAKAFQESKSAIMAIVADLIGVEPDQLQREAEQAA